MLDLVCKVIGWLVPGLVRKWARPLTVVVWYCAYEDMRNRPDDPFVLITPWPRRYRARLSLTNRTDRVVYIQTITLAIEGGKEHEEASSLRLEPGEPKKHDVVFPLAEKEEPVKAGRLIIGVTPSVGRTTEVAGSLPFSRPPV